LPDEMLRLLVVCDALLVGRPTWLTLGHDRFKLG